MTPVQEDTLVIQAVSLVVVHLLALATLIVILKVDHVTAMKIMLDVNVTPVQLKKDTTIFQVAMVSLVSNYQIGF